jgi:hypothetical protein
MRIFLYLWIVHQIAPRLTVVAEEVGVVLDQLDP